MGGRGLLLVFGFKVGLLVGGILVGEVLVKEFVGEMLVLEGVLVGVFKEMLVFGVWLFGFLERLLKSKS